MLDEFYAESGHERCGFVLKDGSVVEVKNVCQDPEQGFTIRPEDVVKYHDQVEATWHTHPGSSNNLSMDDFVGFTNYPYWKHYIVGKNGTARYRVEGTKVMNDG